MSNRVLKFSAINERPSEDTAMSPTPTGLPMSQGVKLTKDLPDIENLLALNPKVKPYASAVPTVVTKKNKKHWKRNTDKADSLKGCG